MMELVQKILEERGPDLIQSLVGKAGFSSEQAQGFLPAAAEKVIAALQRGDLDLGSLLGGGDLASLLSKVDTGALAAETGVDAEKASAGLGELVPGLLSGLGAGSGGVEGLLSALGGEKSGGLLGAAGGLAGKLFK